MKTWIFGTIAVIGWGLYGQVAVNNTGSAADASAMLDIQATDKGVLIPRMSLTERDNNITSPATGLVVYITDDHSFYYFDGTTWLRMITADKAWLLSGNSGIDSNNDFIGTTDAQDLVFKTNNTARMLIDRNGFVSINTNPATASLTVGGSSTLNGLLSFASGGTVFGGAFYNTDANGTAIVGAGNNLGITYLTVGSGMGGVGTQVGIYGFGDDTNEGIGIVGIGNGLSTYYVSGSGAGAEYTGEMYGIRAYFTARNNNAVGVYGGAINAGNYDPIGVYGNAYVGDYYGIGVLGYSGWRGGYFVANGGHAGVYASDNGNSDYAIVSVGDFAATGTKSFLIDHPLDPENKYLKHFSIESDEVLNVYRGNVVLDNQGKAVVRLPSYFLAINRNFSYVLTPVGGPAPDLFVEKEIDNEGKFIIAGGNPGQKISWYVYAERNDPYLQQHPEKRQTEIMKGEKERGKYFRPELYGQPREKSLDYHPVLENPQKPVPRKVIKKDGK